MLCSDFLLYYERNEERKNCVDLCTGLFGDKVSSLGVEIVVVMVGTVLVTSRVGQQNTVLQVRRSGDRIGQSRQDTQYYYHYIIGLLRESFY